MNSSSCFLLGRTLPILGESRMHKKLEAEIFNNCRLIYRNMPDGSETLVKRRGLECDDGWFEILQELSLMIESVAEQMRDQQVPDTNLPLVIQVKEKFGGLRVYTSGAHDKIDQLIFKAQTRAAHTCEICGKAGSLHESDSGWLKTTCNDCENKYLRS